MAGTAPLRPTSATRTPTAPLNPAALNSLAGAKAAPAASAGGAKPAPANRIPNVDLSHVGDKPVDNDALLDKAAAATGPSLIDQTAGNLRTATMGVRNVDTLLDNLSKTRGTIRASRLSESGTVKGAERVLQANEVRRNAMGALNEFAHGNYLKAGEMAAKAGIDGTKLVDDLKPRGAEPRPGMGRLLAFATIMRAGQSIQNFPGNVRRIVSNLAKDNYAEAGKALGAAVSDAANVVAGAQTTLQAAAKVIPQAAQWISKANGIAGQVLGKAGMVGAAVGLATKGVDLVQNWDKMPKSERVAKIAGAISDIAILAAPIPGVNAIAGAVAAGATLVSLAAQNWDKIEAAAGYLAKTDAKTMVQDAGKLANSAVDAVKGGFRSLTGRLSSLF